jgi:septal ring factor EnvC (AmiA/AmiB activator)
VPGSASSAAASQEWRVSRASRLHIALLSALAITASAHAQPSVQAPAPDPHDALAKQIAAEQATLATTITTVDAKLHGADTVRLHRLHAAIRALHAPLAEGASADERMAVARRRAAARLLLERDHSERQLLADEAAHLEQAKTVTADAAQHVPTIALPDSLAVPVHTKVARHFGEYLHERSKATLSRRGVDLEVEDHAPAVAPADGVVRFAGPIRGLDHGVILDHGDYLTVIAKLGELTLPVGTHVAKGDRLGRAAHHRVYLELRAKIGPGGLPIDPEPLFAR